MAVAGDILFMLDISLSIKDSEKKTFPKILTTAADGDL